MRPVLVILGLVLGLLAAAVTGLRMSHLRHLAADRLPPWSAPVRDAAGLLRGGSDPVVLAGVPVSLGWRIAGLGRDGVAWSLGVEAPGQRLAARITLAPDLGRLTLTRGRGEIDLAELDALPGGAVLGGSLVLDALAGELDPAGPRILAVSGAGRWSGARFNGRQIGAGRFELTSGAGSWQIPFTLEGPLVRVTGRLRGRFNVAFAALEMRIADAGAMPEDWKQALSWIATPMQEAGTEAWEIERRIALPAVGVP